MTCNVDFSQAFTKQSHVLRLEWKASGDKPKVFDIPYTYHNKIVNAKFICLEVCFNYQDSKDDPISKYYPKIAPNGQTLYCYRDGTTPVPYDAEIEKLFTQYEPIELIHRISIGEVPDVYKSYIWPITGATLSGAISGSLLYGALYSLEAGSPVAAGLCFSFCAAFLMIHACCLKTFAENIIVNHQFEKFWAEAINQNTMQIVNHPPGPHH